MDAGDDRELERARALGDPTRLAIYRRVEAAGGEPVDIATLTALVGFHHTAVRQHLRKLIRAGLVEEQPLPPRGPGRPRTGYRVAGRVTPGEAYAQLAALLAEAVRTGTSPRDVGRAAAQRAPAAHDMEPVDALVAEATRLGFEPVVDGTDVVLGACPYEEVASIDPATVCALHLGMAEGLLEDADLEVAGLDPADPRLGGCRLRLTARLTIDDEPPAEAPVRRRADQPRGTRHGG